MENEGELINAHKFSSKNKEYISSSETCGCFHCLRVFPASRVQEWVNEGVTARCPFCSIDSVLPSNMCDISAGLLQRMNEYWFKRVRKYSKTELEEIRKEGKWPPPKKRS
jgi:hypothetical protein